MLSACCKVSIHTRAWRATLEGQTEPSFRQFQFTPARGGRPVTMVSGGGILQFQFAPARGGRRGANVASLISACFNSRPRVAGDLRARLPRGVARFQFTPARGGRQNPQSRTMSKNEFQFPPARGGRLRLRGGKTMITVSIHARALRATDNAFSVAEHDRFQFTPARGGRLYLPNIRRKYVQVSIHARAWRATCRPPRSCASTCFNSRPRVAGDRLHHERGRRVQVSIHARAWRATQHTRPRPREHQVSIHARAWRATIATAGQED